jgi:hypothetical protein
MCHLAIGAYNVWYGRDGQTTYFVAGYWLCTIVKYYGTSCIPPTTIVYDAMTDQVVKFVSELKIQKFKKKPEWPPNDHQMTLNDPH